MAPGEAILIGDPVTWSYVVTNSGDVTLADLVVGDDDSDVTVDCGDGTDTIALLVPGDQRTCTASGVVAEAGEYRNLGDVAGVSSGCVTGSVFFAIGQASHGQMLYIL